MENFISFATDLERANHAALKLREWGLPVQEEVSGCSHAQVIVRAVVDSNKIRDMAQQSDMWRFSRAGEREQITARASAGVTAKMIVRKAGLEVDCWVDERELPQGVREIDDAALPVPCQVVSKACWRASIGGRFTPSSAGTLIPSTDVVCFSQTPWSPSGPSVGFA